MYTYNITMTDFTKLAIKNDWHNAVFIFAEEHDLSKLSTAPNITMQFSPYDEELPIILVLVNSALSAIYDNALPPNTYILQLDKNALETAKLSAWEYVLNSLKLFKPIQYALFAEWYTVISQNDKPLNMNKNPHYDWEGQKIDVDSSDWYKQMCITSEQNILCALGVDRRHNTDLLGITGHVAEPYPMQMVLYNFINLRKLDLGLQRTHASNYMVRDTVLALQIMADGGAVNTVPQFTISAPTVTYTEDDLHIVLELPKKFKGVLND
jgi:hypothetical protein